MRVSHHSDSPRVVVEGVLHRVHGRHRLVIRFEGAPRTMKAYPISPAVSNACATRLIDEAITSLARLSHVCGTCILRRSRPDLSNHAAPIILGNAFAYGKKSSRGAAESAAHNAAQTLRRVPAG